ncbi:MAG: putative hydrophobic protein (TIGR00271 family), partial [Arenicella sp.]
MSNQVGRSFSRIGGEIKNIFSFLKRVLFKITHLADDTDIEGTIKDIKGGVVLEGSNLWILIFSAGIACVGLNTGSPAVIIGAMLISPLMSPILGIGLSAGINDKEYLIKSVYNFGIATGLSLLVSFIYFYFTPLDQFTDEMRSRITPTILDAGVALFGGLAGIIAGSRTEKTNAIPGVAIATALMPPLCTAGYGLAKGEFQEIFLGAFYLFFMNAVLISLSTYAVVRILKFPLVEQEDPESATRVKSMVFIVILLLLYPSYYFLEKTLRELEEQGLVETFITDNIHDIKNGVDWTPIAVSDTVSKLEVYYFGEAISDDSTNVLKEKLERSMREKGYAGVWQLELIPTAAQDNDKVVIRDRVSRLQQDMERIENNLILRQLTEDSLIAE